MLIEKLIDSIIRQHYFVSFNILMLSVLIYVIMYIKLCENIGISIQIYKSTNPGSNKIVYAQCEQKSNFFIVLIMQNHTFVIKNY